MPNGLPTTNTWLPRLGPSGAMRIGRTARGARHKSVKPVSGSAATQWTTWRRPEKSRATIVAGFFPFPGDCPAGGASIRTESNSPRLLMTTPEAIRRVPGGASAAVYSKATTDCRARDIAAAIRPSNCCRAVNNAASASSCDPEAGILGSPAGRSEPATPSPTRSMSHPAPGLDLGSSTPGPRPVSLDVMIASAGDPAGVNRSGKYVAMGLNHLGPGRKPSKAATKTPIANKEPSVSQTVKRFERALSGVENIMRQLGSRATWVIQTDRAL